MSRNPALVLALPQSLFLGCLWCLIGLPSCQLVFDYERFEGKEQGDGGQGGAGPVEPSPGCARTHATAGTRLIPIMVADNSCFWIDEHEVTQGQYDAFVQSGPPRQSTPCEWNDSYTDEACESSLRTSALPDQPRTCVDQCDAQAYCESVGKTLCRSSYTGVAARDDWGSVCSKNGENPLPYGKSGDPTVCNVQERGLETTNEVDQNTGCETSEGVRDLVGNVAEWVGGSDGCQTNAGADDACLIRGGSFSDPFQSANCDTSKNPRRSARYDFVGFRCCAYSH